MGEMGMCILLVGREILDTRYRVEVAFTFLTLMLWRGYRNMMVRPLPVPLI